MHWFLMGLGLMLATLAHAQIRVLDDAGQPVTLAQPARRVVALAPHATELVFAAGGGRQLVGVVAYSDFPPEARRLPLVGDNRALDFERLLALKPDLLVVWRHGNPERELARLKTLGIPIFHSEPQRLEQVASSLERLGQLLGTEAQARPAASRLRQQWQDLARRYRDRPKLRVFHPVWHRPLMTVNDQHISSEVIRLCGGINVFGTLPGAAPTVSLEAVLAAQPQVILGDALPGAQGLIAPEGFGQWQQWPQLPATRHHNLFLIDTNHFSRNGPRQLLAAEAVCQALDTARQHLGIKP